MRPLQKVSCIKRTAQKFSLPKKTKNKQYNAVLVQSKREKSQIQSNQVDQAQQKTASLGKTIRDPSEVDQGG